METRESRLRYLATLLTCAGILPVCLDFGDCIRRPGDRICRKKGFRADAVILDLRLGWIGWAGGSSHFDGKLVGARGSMHCVRGTDSVLQGGQSECRRLPGQTVRVRWARGIRSAFV